MTSPRPPVLDQGATSDVTNTRLRSAVGGGAEARRLLLLAVRGAGVAGVGGDRKSVV